MVLQPGENLTGTSDGPYTTKRGYKPAPVMMDGKDVLGYGGGTCQVSSTLYNVVLQLPGLEVLYRHAHGGSGASYLPIHVDAAVGRDDLNLRFTNRYDFPIRIEASSKSDGALSIRIYRAGYTEKNPEIAPGSADPRTRFSLRRKRSHAKCKI